ncbi:HAD family hydrolase [Pseudonocardia nigra]|uniref:HAD family hydrolase n=1 Tax=Pseudonocardia nigra TaxID=1921578 RepID=UPI0027E34DAC|nr:HAD-IA family hydrolase [Pseudonocardia nigra]
MRSNVLIVDLDGVVRHWDPTDMAELERRNGLPPGSVLGTAFRPDLLTSAITGGCTDEEWRDAVARTLAERYGVGAWRAVAEWAQPCGSVDEDVLDLLRERRRGQRVALLSNATSRLPADLAHLGLDREFDAVFGTWELGVAKPDPRVFERVCNALGEAPDDCLFVDDTAGHVVAARAAGLRVHHYRTYDGLVEALRLDG